MYILIVMIFYIENNKLKFTEFFYLGNNYCIIAQNRICVRGIHISTLFLKNVSKLT